MKLLICGDSFSFDHQHPQSWVTQLSSYADVVNLSQCGCSEYKIKQQLESIDVTEFDKIFVFHTSPSRLYLGQPNPLAVKSTHINSDLVFSDVEEKRYTHELARIAYEYYVNIYDKKYYEYVHSLICADIDSQTKHLDVVHFTNFDYTGLYNFGNNLINFYSVWAKNKGNINHYSVRGNKVLLEKILKLL